MRTPKPKIILKHKNYKNSKTYNNSKTHQIYKNEKFLLEL